MPNPATALAAALPLLFQVGRWCRSRLRGVDRFRGFGRKKSELPARQPLRHNRFTLYGRLE
jgi:hypothetical protein